MYKIDPSPDLSKSRRSAYQSPLINNAAKLYRIFFSIESAMAHACRIYKLSVILRRENGRRSMELSIDINSLLDDLALTVRDIPPFAFGESSLVWGYFVAASNSILPDHRAFYNSRLAKLLHRIGHGNIKSIMAAANAI